MTFVLYVVVYTPLKTRTTLNTLVGAVPGALPPLDRLGRGGRPAGPGSLVAFPHRFSLAVSSFPVDRLDLSRRLPARRFPDADRRRASADRITGCQAFSYALVLVPAGLLPGAIGLAGPIYSVGALLLGLYYLVDAARFWLDATDQRARRLLYSSFLYLPAILILLLLNSTPY